MPEWYEEFPTEDADWIKARGWDKPLTPELAGSMAKAFRDTQQKLGVPADQIIRMPKDANDPNYQAAYERIAALGVPKDPAEYTFDQVRAKSGAELSPDEIERARSIAAELKLPAHAARVLAAREADRREAEKAATDLAAATNKQMNDAAIRANWGQEYDQKQFSAVRAAESVGFTAEVIETMGRLPPEKYVANMNALVSLGMQMNEAAMLRGGRAPVDPAAGLNPVQAKARLDELGADTRWLARFASGDAQAQNEWRRLTEQMVVRQ